MHFVASVVCFNIVLCHDCFKTDQFVHLVERRAHSNTITIRRIVFLSFSLSKIDETLAFTWLFTLLHKTGTYIIQ